MRPSTITVSMLAGGAASTNMCTGSSARTARLSARVFTKITSARLPGVSEPICELSPIHRAPSMVASSSSFRGATASSFFVRPASMFWKAMA